MFQLCDVNPIDFWDYLPRETFDMIDWSEDKRKKEDIKRADLIAHIRNAPHFTKKDNKPWVYTEFLPQEMDPGMSPEEFEEYMWNMAEEG
jgi:hypothetical protein